MIFAFESITEFFGQAEVVLETSSNSSKPGFPVALGTGCEGKSISLLDVCRQVKCHSMYLFHYFKKTL